MLGLSLNHVRKRLTYGITYNISNRWKWKQLIILIIYTWNWGLSKCELVHFFKAQYQIYIWDMNLVIPVSADVLAPKGARPSAGTVLTGDFILSQILSRILNTFSLITGRYSMKSHMVSWHRVNEDDDLRFHPHGNILIHHTVSLYVIHVIEISTTTREKTYHELLAQWWYHITMMSDDDKDISNSTVWWKSCSG